MKKIEIIGNKINEFKIFDGKDLVNVFKTRDYLLHTSANIRDILESRVLVAHGKKYDPPLYENDGKLVLESYKKHFKSIVKNDRYTGGFSGYFPNGVMPGIYFGKIRLLQKNIKSKSITDPNLHLPGAFTLCLPVDLINDCKISVFDEWCGGIYEEKGCSIINMAEITKHVHPEIIAREDEIAIEEDIISRSVVIINPFTMGIYNNHTSDEIIFSKVKDQKALEIIRRLKIPIVIWRPVE